MDELRAWHLRRYTTFVLVLTLHMALLAALIMASLTRSTLRAPPPELELVLLSPTPAAKIHSAAFRPRPVSADSLIAVAPPYLDSSALSPPAAGSQGSGSGVDWAAEARRAVQAFEIRKHRPASDKSIAGPPAEDNWWPQSKHHAGEQFKTASGDWIIWINSTCYQLASSVATGNALGAPTGPTVCLHEPITSRIERIDQ